MTYRAIIVEDEPLTLESMRQSLDASPELDIVGIARTLADGRLAIEQPYDVLLVDLNLQGESGLDLIRTARLDPDVKILVVTMFGDEDSTISAIEAGADGYVLKGSEQLDISDSVLRVIEGEAPMSPAIARYLLKYVRQSQTGHSEDADYQLSNREQQVLEALALGWTYKEVAREYDLTYSTVNGYVKTLYKKLAVNSRGEAVNKALRNGLIDLNRD